MIRVEGLSKRYKKTLAVDDLSFSVDGGSVVGFLGPNGAGKTTTLRALLGLIRPTAGQALLLDRPYTRLNRPAHDVGAVLEASGFHPGRTGANHLRVQARAIGVPRARVAEMLELVGLESAAKKRVGAYSLGMRQRLAIAAALLGEPKILILDEPANGLDPEGIRWLRQLLRSLADQGAAVLVSSHVLSEVAQTVDHVVIISRGRLIRQGSVAELTAGQGAEVRVRTPDPATLIARLQEAGLTAQELDGTLLVSGGDSAQIGELAAASGVVLHELTPVSSQLEDVFLELTSGQSA